MRQSDSSVGRAFDDDVLPPDHATALQAAIDELIHEFCEDVAPSSTRRVKAEETSMARYLPRCIAEGTILRSRSDS